MSRVTTRVFGVVVGILAGTIAAMLVRYPFKETTVRDVKSVQVREADESPDDGALILKEVSPNESLKEDPGKRKELAGLVAGARAEPGWLKEFELTERSGKQVKSQDLIGQPYIACFFFTTCPGTCKRQSDQMRLLQSKFRDKPIRFVSISVDPEIDTPEVLSKYAESFGADKEKWLFLTGPLDSIMRIGIEKFFLSGIEKRGHPDQFCLMSRDGEIVGSYDWRDKDERALLVEHANELLSK